MILLPVQAHLINECGEQRHCICHRYSLTVWVLKCYSLGCLCVYVCVHVYVCICVCVSVCVCVFLCSPVYLCGCVFTSVCMYVNVCFKYDTWVGCLKQMGGKCVCVCVYVCVCEIRIAAWRD